MKTIGISGDDDMIEIGKIRCMNLIWTCNILLTLLAPKTLWTLPNLWGSSAGKYGAKTQSLAHLLLRSLHAAHGDIVPCFLPPSFMFLQFLEDNVRSSIFWIVEFSLNYLEEKKVERGSVNLRRGMVVTGDVIYRDDMWHKIFCGSNKRRDFRLCWTKTSMLIRSFTPPYILFFVS